ncbi:hypothetical protein BH11VER1_BH11VER1_36140 [soil metagenome]
MLKDWDHAAFWGCDDAFVAVSPHRTQDAEGLVDFAAAHLETKGLVFFQTSGSEGVAKWVGLSRQALLASARAVNSHLEATSKDRWLMALPGYHVGGFSILARCQASGASFDVVHEKWEPHHFVEICRASKTTLVSLVPTQVYDLVQAQLAAPKSLRAVVVGGGPLSKEIGNQAMELGWPVLQSFGMTEAGSQIATEPLDHLYAGFDPDLLEVLGGWSLQVDAEGCLIVRGEALASGYAQKKDGHWEWSAIDRQEGLRTRDRVQLWQHGTREFLRFMGRDASFVKIMGELVSLPVLQAKLELLCVEHHGSPHACLIWPVYEARKGTQLILVGELPQEQLQSLCEKFNTGVPGFERLEKTQTVAALPRTELGKIDREALHRLVKIP